MDVAAIWRYPVKSMGGERIDAAAIGPNGMEGDRSYAIVDREDGKVASAKNPRKWASLLQFGATYVDTVDGPVRITFPDGTVRASDDADIDEQLGAALGRRVTLTQTVPEKPTYEADWPDVEGVIPPDFLATVTTGPGSDGGTLTALKPKRGTFMDFAAIHLLAAATLTHLGELAPASAFDVRRYRPNVVVGDAATGFVENGWTTSDISIGEALVLRPVVPTMRCIMTTLPQGDLPRDPGTLRAVATHNRLDLPGVGVWSCVGLYAEVVAPGAIRVGDTFRA
ncbi:MAG: MOSC domain-containing protein [Acidimicrobiales bacterium]